MNARVAAVLGLSALVLAGLAFLPALSTAAQAQPNEPMRKMEKTRYASGAISSIQTGADGTKWIVSGSWRASCAGCAEDMEEPRIKFNAKFTMVMPDGSAKHTHTISDFAVSEWSAAEGRTSFNGTATISLRDGPTPDVPVDIVILGGNVIQVHVDSTVVDHFGSSPIYGVVAKNRIHAMPH
jgi:hypothetical protein